MHGINQLQDTVWRLERLLAAHRRYMRFLEDRLVELGQCSACHRQAVEAGRETLCPACRARLVPDTDRRRAC